MKKLTIVLIGLAIVFSITGCGNKVEFDGKGNAKVDKDATVSQCDSDSVRDYIVNKMTGNLASHYLSEKVSKLYNEEEANCKTLGYKLVCAYAEDLLTMGITGKISKNSPKPNETQEVLDDAKDLIRDSLKLAEVNYDEFTNTRTCKMYTNVGSERNYQFKLSVVDGIEKIRGN